MLRILLADDDPISTTMMSRALTRRGYRVEAFTDGQSAWDRLVAENPPDLAILDWYMPGLTGPEITERYAQQEDRPFLYRIILSGRLDKSSIIEALHRGAHDILEKPCDMALIFSRLEVAARMIREHRVVEEMAKVMKRYGEKMEQLAQERAQQLVHADRMSSLGAMAAGIAHEINNPMSFISGNAQTVQRYWKDLETILGEHIPELAKKDKRIPVIFEEMPKALSSIMKGVDRVTTIVKGLKKYCGKTDAAFREKVNINSCVDQAVMLCNSNFPKSLSLRKALGTDIPLISANPVEIEQVLVNLLVNAAHAMEKSETQILTITTSQSDSFVQIEVEDSGPGIPSEMLDKIWDPFVTTKPLGKGTGLGLSISSGIVKGHGGSLSANNREKGGACFVLKLPKSSEARNA